MERINTEKFLGYLREEKIYRQTLLKCVKTEDCTAHLEGFIEALDLIKEHIEKEDAVHKEVFDYADDSATALNKLVRYDNLEKEYVKMVEKYVDREQTVICEFSGDFKGENKVLRDEVADCIQNVINGDSVRKLCDIVDKIEEEWLLED